MAATLLDLTQQGDVATISDESKLDQVKLLRPQQLYELWERQQRSRRRSTSPRT